MRLVRLRVGTSHGRHCTVVRWRVSQLILKLTRSGRHLVHLGSLRTWLHVHHRRLLVSLLRSLMTHHGRSRPRAGETVGAGRHVAGILRVPRSLRVHLHLGLARHTHERSVRGVLLHQVSTHLRPRAINELAALRATERNMLDTRAHAVLWHLHLLRVTGHWLRLRTIDVRRHLARRGLDR